jgi:hypothetical protein
MTRISGSALGAWSLRILAIAGLITGFASSAEAGGLFDALFGGFSAPPRPVARAYADPSADVRSERTERSEAPAAVASSSGRRTFCVRLCDGRFFPLMAANNATPVETCNAMCPASKTRVFHGGTEIGSATDANGARYSGLEQAFLYRKTIVPGCTCNGKDAFGLAPVEVMADPTLRRGDIVATSDGLKAFEGGRSEAHKTADFTPAQNARVSGSLRDRLSSLRVSEKQ